MLTSAQIEAAKRNCRTVIREPHHEHDDCILIAYEWLDAQKKIKGPTSKTYAIKHIIESWAERYVSQSDVEVAAYLHSDILGRYPYFNISARLVEPDTRRLDGIQEAFTHPIYRRSRRDSIYHSEEKNCKTVQK